MGSVSGWFLRFDDEWPGDDWILVDVEIASTAMVTRWTFFNPIGFNGTQRTIYRLRGHDPEGEALKATLGHSWKETRIAVP